MPPLEQRAEIPQPDIVLSKRFDTSPQLIREIAALYTFDTLPFFTIAAPPEPRIRNIGGVNVAGIQYRTARQGDWFVAQPDQLLTLHTEPFILGGENPFKEKSVLENDEQVQRHRRNIAFVGANWSEHIFPLLSGNPEQVYDNLPWYQEVDFTHYIVKLNIQKDIEHMETCSQADFIGRGPDGHYTLIDFGSHTRRKANQLQKQMLGMAQSFKEGGNSIPRITPFVGRYMVSPDCKDNILQFVPPDLNLFDPSLKIIGKILHNKETNERTRQEIAA